MSSQAKPAHAASGASPTRVGGPESFVPYIPAASKLPEFRLVPILVGSVLGMIFGASSLYLVLKTGLTVSASIPVAVISMALFKTVARVFRTRDATILENNI